MSVLPELNKISIKSPGIRVRGFFFLLLFILGSAVACGKKPKEVLQHLDDGTITRRHFEVDGLKEGAMTDYYPDGSVKGVRHFHHDIQQGSSVWYYQDGTRKESQQFIDGVQTGPDSMWMANGNLQRVILFEDGLKHGPMRTWDEHGVLILEVIFAHDSLITVNKSLNQPETSPEAE